jgi:hypothetical protein
MSGPFQDDDDEFSMDDFPTLAAVAGLARLVPQVPWFTSVGTAIDAELRAAADSYVSALGFPDATVADVIEWEDAEFAAANPDWNTDWWEAEEQLRVALTAEAVELLGDEEMLVVALTNVTKAASECVHVAAAGAAGGIGRRNPALVRAAAGAATQASYQTALLLAAGGEEDHPFALKFRLFEAGRWPLGIVGSSFNIF